MDNYYNLDIIPIILNRFKVNRIIVSGLGDENITHKVLTYCNDNNASYIGIDSNQTTDENVIIDFTLNVLPNLSGFDAIFLNDDPNWYTVFNELNLVKRNNDTFPLVFICHNIFPHKRRDSYVDPSIIPDDFLNECSEYLSFQNIHIQDGFFHAVHENGPKNGVLTAIEDFINENQSIGIMNIKFFNGITILYFKDSISKIRIGRILEEIEGYEVELDGLSDNIVENQLLINYIDKYNLNEDNSVIDDLKVEINKKDMIINDFENQIEFRDNELSLKDSQINNFNSKLDLKEVQLKNIESKLVNRDVEINNLNNEIDSLKLRILQNEKRELELNEQLNFANNQIKDNIDLLNDKNNEIKLNMHKINQSNQKFNAFKRQYINQASRLDNKKYCITCYKEEIENKCLEIEYLKQDTLTRKLLSPLSYVYLIFKSKPNELLLNFKLYKTIKNSKCFDIGFYLNNNQDIKDSKWCKYFSPELHYICNGFNEERTFNKKYFNRNSKRELLDYIINCEY